MAETGYINPEVAKMYGKSYNELTPEEKKILNADSKRRAKLIKEREDNVLKNNLKAFADEKQMEKVLGQIYTQCQKEILASVTETIAKVQKAGGKWSYANQSALTRSRGLFEQISEQIKALGQKEQLVFTQGLSNIFTDQFLREVYGLGQVQAIKASFNKLNPTYIKQAINYPWSGAMFSDRLWNDKATLGRNLRIGLTQSMVLGESIPQLMDRITKNINTSLYNAERLARTETRRVTYVAQSEIWEENGVKELRYRCANGGDNRTCDPCRSDNGKIYKKGEEPSLPRHPNCRCTYIPVARDTFEDNELNDLTGSVRGAENYDKWKQEYAVALDENGNYKAGWARDPKDFKVKYTAPDGKQYTLEEYKKANLTKAPLIMLPKTNNITLQSVEKSYEELYNKYELDINKVRSVGAINRVTNQYLADVGSNIKRVDFGKMDVETAREVSKHLIQLDKMWISTLQEVDVVDRIGNGIAGVCTPYIDIWERTKNDKDLYSRIKYALDEINPTASLAYWEQNKKSFPYNYNSLVDKKYVMLQSIYHEYGHSILGGKVSKVYGTNSTVFAEIEKLEAEYKSEKAKYQQIMQEAKYGWGKYEKMTEKEREKIIKEAEENYKNIFVSRYANDSTGEFIAECFANASLCSNPSPYSVKVLEILKKYFGK